jgi:hypothetical protein
VATLLNTYRLWPQPDLHNSNSSPCNLYQS